MKMEFSSTDGVISTILAAVSVITVKLKMKDKRLDELLTLSRKQSDSLSEVRERVARIEGKLE